MKAYAAVSARVIAILLVAACLVGVILAAPRFRTPDEYPNSINPEKNITVGDVSISYKNLTALSSQPNRLDGKNTDIEELPKVGSMVELLRMFDEMGLFYAASELDGGEKGIYSGTARNESAVMADGAAEAPAAAPAPTAAPQVAADTGGAGHSETNAQVSGVDEGDIVKTDGEYIYYAGNSKISIVKADGGNLKREALIEVGENANFSEMYVKGDYLIAVVTRYENIAYDGGIMPRIAIWNPGKSFTSFIVYDITDRSAPKEVRRVEAEGNSISTRMIENTVYFVTNKWLYAVPYQDLEPIEILPAYRDTAISDDMESIDAADIAYCPGRLEPTYMLVGAFNIDDFEPCVPEAFLGSGSTIYASMDSLYVIRPVYEYQNNESVAYRFAIDGREIEFMGSGRFAGQVINQYSMDEHDGYFRIATTEWTEGGSENHLFILDNSTMKITGSLTGLAKGETIRSVRFMGETGYIVTFEQTDPLFVIDLKNPAAPKVLGELKIPGFSQYLHPFDDGILVGIGRHTREMYVRDEDGVEIVVGVQDAGLKLSMFDVSDPAKPKELHKLIVGTMSTYTEASHNPRALMADLSKGILAFPMQDYSEKSFTGCAVISADKASGFKLEARLAAEKEYGEFSWQTRACYIGNTLYMASTDCITAYDYDSYKKIGTTLEAFK